MGPFTKGDNTEVKIDDGCVKYCIPELIIKKRNGIKLNADEINWFITQLVAGQVEDVQLGMHHCF